MSPKSFEDRWLELLVEDMNSKADAYYRAKKQLDYFVNENPYLSWKGDKRVPEVTEE